MTNFTNNKDPTPSIQQSNVVHEFKCPGCNANYIGKTERTLCERTHEHGWTNKDKPVYQHLMNCSGFQHILSINRYHDIFPIDQTLGLDINQDLDFKNSLIQVGRNNTKVLDKALNWDILLIKEGVYI